MTSPVLTSPDIGELLTPEQLDASLRHALLDAGYQPTLSDTWGRIVGDSTAFLEVGTEGSLAWLYCPQKEAFVGPRLHAQGAPAVAVAHVLRQLADVLASHELSGSEELTLAAGWEVV